MIYFHRTLQLARDLCTGTSKPMNPVTHRHSQMLVCPCDLMSQSLIDRLGSYMIGSTFSKLLPTAHLHLRRDLSPETSKNTYPVYIESSKTQLGLDMVQLDCLELHVGNACRRISTAVAHLVGRTLLLFSDSQVPHPFVHWMSWSLGWNSHTCSLVNRFLVWKRRVHWIIHNAT